MKSYQISVEKIIWSIKTNELEKNLFIQFLIKVYSHFWLFILSRKKGWRKLMILWWLKEFTRNIFWILKKINNFFHSLFQQSQFIIRVQCKVWNKLFTSQLIGCRLISEIIPFCNSVYCVQMHSNFVVEHRSFKCDVLEWRCTVNYVFSIILNLTESAYAMHHMCNTEKMECV